MGLDLQQLCKISNIPRSIILLQGETGTGKSYIAKFLHEKSSHKNFPFVSVDLACMKEDLMESELFGHKKGSFTSAHTDKEGIVSQVQQGTLFLDEIGELSLEAQKKLLFLIEEKTYRPLGSHRSLQFVGHIIAATNINLLEKVKRKEFREDLYFRLNIFEYKTAPLRENKKHLLEKAQEFLGFFCQKYNRPGISLNMEIIRIFQQYSWPGNLRELKNALEYMVAIYDKDQALEKCLPDHILYWRQNLEKEMPPNPLRQAPYIEISTLPKNFSVALGIFEKKFLAHFLKMNDYKINQTAKELSISKTTLIYKKNKYGIPDS